MSIASKLKVIALEMGAELSQDDDSVEEILAKMQGHVGGSGSVSDCILFEVNETPIGIEADCNKTYSEISSIFEDSRVVPPDIKVGCIVYRMSEGESYSRELISFTKDDDYFEFRFDSELTITVYEDDIDVTNFYGSMSQTIMVSNETGSRIYDAFMNSDSVVIPVAKSDTMPPTIMFGNYNEKSNGISINFIDGNAGADELTIYEYVASVDGCSLKFKQTYTLTKKSASH